MDKIYTTGVLAHIETFRATELNIMQAKHYIL